MKIMIHGVTSIFLLAYAIHCSGHFLPRDAAAVHAQKGEWEKSYDILQSIMVDAPHDAQVLYDAGVASYKMNNAEQAQIYFSDAAKYAHSASLKEQAYFNAGNACVQQKKLQEAVDAYEAVLDLNADNERARHNLEIVKKMLEQQKQEDEQKQQQQDKDNKNEQDQKKEEQSNQKNDQQGDKDKNQQDQQSGGQKNGDTTSQENDSDSEHQNGSDDNQQNNDRDADKREDQKKDSKQGEREQESTKDDGSQNDSSKHPGDQPQQENGTDKRDDERMSQKDTPQDQQQQDGEQQEDMQEMQKEQVGTSPYDAAQELDARLARILDRQEEKDADLTKQVIKMHVDKQLAGQHGQNCW